jgi:CubicO group peptidase (beta-lactamase class C family)
MMKTSTSFLGLFLVLASACGEPAETETTGSAALAAARGRCAAERAEIEDRLINAIDAAAGSSLTSDPNMTLLLEGEDGRSFTHSTGNSEKTKSYESASTSKLVSAVVILDLVAKGKLDLDSKPSKLIPFWKGERAVTLRHLLSFRSGFNLEADCSKEPDAIFEECVHEIYDQNIDVRSEPGTEFFYSSSHLQIAGLMAMKATHKTWLRIFNDWRDDTGLFPHGAYDLPSERNPRLAGGMHWTGEEYLALLRRLSQGTLLTPALRAELFGNQRGHATVAQSPIIEAYDEDWAYGFGNWLECPTASGPDSFNCRGRHRNSSPGAYGAYPFIDFDHGMIGMLARQGKPRTFREGLDIYRSVEDLANEWADHRCDP